MTAREGWGRTGAHLLIGLDNVEKEAEDALSGR